MCDISKSLNLSGFSFFSPLPWELGLNANSKKIDSVTLILHRLFCATCIPNHDIQRIFLLWFQTVAPALSHSSPVLFLFFFFFATNQQEWNMVFVILWKHLVLSSFHEYNCDILFAWNVLFIYLTKFWPFSHVQFNVTAFINLPHK